MLTAKSNPVGSSSLPGPRPKQPARNKAGGPLTTASQEAGAATARPSGENHVISPTGRLSIASQPASADVIDNSLVNMFSD